MAYMKSIFFVLPLFIFLLFPINGALAKEGVNAEVFLLNAAGDGAKIGVVKFKDTKKGLVIATNLKGLPPGEHGFHVHEKPNCGSTKQEGSQTVVLGGAAGGHYDPAATGKHMGPENGGHLGDLPLLKVNDDGTAKMKLHIKGLKAEQFKNRAIIIHAGGDNYSDIPTPLGGGGARMACGIIK